MSVFNRRIPVSARWTSLVLSALVGLACAQPLLRGLLVHGHDTLLHVYRLVAFKQALLEGVLYPRWLPLLAYGYGAPVLYFYAPLWYYLAAIPALLGADAAQATMIAAAVTWCLGAAGMFLWVHDWSGSPRAAVIASAAFATAPYLSFNALHRGAFAEMLALCLAPIVFWALHRWTLLGSARFGLLASVALALLVLSHNLSALVLTPLLVGYGLLISLGAPNRPAALGRASLALGLGLGLSAFFWLPALAEQHAIQLERAFVQTDLDFRKHFVLLEELLSPPPRSEAQQLNNPLPRSLSLVALSLGLLGAVVAARQHPQARLVAVFAVFAFGLCISLVFPLAQGVWERVPLLQIIQFPWRLIGVGTLFLAVLAGIGYTLVDGMLRRSAAAQAIAFALTILALGGYGIGWQFPVYHRIAPPLSADAIPDFERRLNVPTLSSGEYLSRATQTLPERNARTPLDPIDLPTTATLDNAACTALGCSFVLSTASEITLALNVFYFPAWKGYVNGHPHPLLALPPHGLIGVRLASGESRVQISFELTPAGWAGAAVSASAAALWVGMLGIALRQRKQRHVSVVLSPQHPLGMISAVAAILALCSLAAFRATLEVMDTPLHYRRLDGEQLAEVALPVHINFDDQLVLIGMDAPSSIPAADVWAADLYWQPVQLTRRNYHVALQVVDATGALIAQSNTQRPGGIPTALWPMGSYVRDRHTVAFPAGTPPGAYFAHVVVHEADRPEQRLVARDRQGNPLSLGINATTARLAQLRITPPRDEAPRATQAQVTPEHPLPSQTESALNLLGHSGLPERLQAGDAFRFALYWRLDRAAAQPITPEISLMQPGAVMLNQPVEPIPGYPITHWRPGEVWRAPLVLRIPPSMPGGTWTVRAHIGARVVDLGVIQVDAPTRTFVPPAARYPLNVRFGDFAQLVGCDVPDAAQRGGTVLVTLYWQAQAEPSARYKVFVHLLDAHGERRLGNDSTPAMGKRPTSSWVKGEFIVDPHVLTLPSDLPSGTYRLLVGLYDEFTLARLTTAQGEDAVLIGHTLTVR